MNHLKIKICAGIVLVVALGLIIAAGCSAPQKIAPPTTTVTEGFTPLVPGPNDTRIAYWTARFLEEGHYSQQVLDKAMSERFFDGYLETLDPQRENFLQSDIDEFAHYRTNLDKLTVGGSGWANLSPAYEIFERFLERIRQHTDYVNQLLKQDRFKINTDEHIATDRRHAPYPNDLTAAEDLWRSQLRYEYLQDKLDLEFSPTNGGTVLPFPKNAETNITDQLARRYNWTLHTLTNWDSGNVLQIYLNALTHAYDPHTDYLNEQRAADFSISMSLSLFGIGARLVEDEGYCTIDSLVPGGPADKSGQIREKDRIIYVAQSNLPPVNVVDMDLTKVVELIRGPKDTQVRLTVDEKNRPSSRHVVILTRDEIKLEDQEAKARLIELPDERGGTNRIGVISVPSFYFPTDLSGNMGNSKQSYISVDVAKLIDKLEQEKVAGIILDMRGNPGGSLEEAIRFTGLFIKKGPVVQVRDYDGNVAVKSSANPSVLYSGPLVVLLNRFSASAAEIVAAALQDYGRAVVAGDTSTHGKGTVQSLMRLNSRVWPATSKDTNDPGTLKLTISKFYRVTGASTQLKGVESDIVLPDILNYSPDIGENALENPLPWDSIPGANFQKLNLVQPYLDELRQNSETRTATNQDFNYVRQDIEEYKKIQADKTATLNEQAALKERKEDAVRKTARDREIEARKAPEARIYEITVENADKPGLPEPMPLIVTKTNSVGTTGTGQNFTTITTTSLLPIITTSPIPPDPMLNEAENILEDYIPLVSKNGGVIANQ
jgi:carboxyl-terminal processing protease